MAWPEWPTVPPPYFTTDLRHCPSVLYMGKCPTFYFWGGELVPGMSDGMFKEWVPGENALHPATVCSVPNCTKRCIMDASRWKNWQGHRHRRRHDTAVTQLFCLITTVAQHTIHIAFTDDRRHHYPGAVLDEIFFVGGGGGPRRCWLSSAR